MPSAIQDAEHMYASFRHMLDFELEHDVRYYWEHPHVLLLHVRPPRPRASSTRSAVERVMWSTDFPHNESTFGYSESSLAVGGRRRRS